MNERWFECLGHVLATCGWNGRSRIALCNCVWWHTEVSDTAKTVKEEECPSQNTPTPITPKKIPFLSKLLAGSGQANKKSKKDKDKAKHKVKEEEKKGPKMPPGPRAFGYDVTKGKAYVLCPGGEKLYSDDFTQDSETMMVSAHWLKDNVSWVVPALGSKSAAPKRTQCMEP